ncbi:MAG: hypothetical protein DSZ23_01770, partial [Thermodesulfatator sp.]
IMAPLGKARDDVTQLRKELVECQRSGFVRCRIGQDTFYLEDALSGSNLPSGSVSVVIDRIIMKRAVGDRIADSLRQALEIGEGRAEVEISDKSSGPVKEIFFSEVLRCFSCGSSKDFARRLLGRSLEEVVSLPLKELQEYLENLVTTLDRSTRPEIIAAVRSARELQEHLDVFLDLGLEYLALNSEYPNLSSGEKLKLRLGSVLCKELSGVLYILDEPMSGLPAKEKDLIREEIIALRDAGNTVVLVEHDVESVKRFADYQIELGPGAGQFGGELLRQGFLSKGSLGQTNQRPKRKRNASKASGSHERFRLVGIPLVPVNNLKEKFIELPVSTVIGITGPTGSGKSSLALSILNSLKGAESGRRPGGRRSLETARQKAPPKPFQGKVWFMDDLLPRGSYSSVIATYTGIYRYIAGLFASTPEGRARGITPGFLSLNKKGGRCEMCRGQGFKKVESDFIPPLKLLCDSCLGRRFSNEVMSLTYRGLNLSDVLRLTVTQAATFFRNISAIRRRLEAVERAGLGYLTLGQMIPSLSGGERQRLKLATVIAGDRRNERGLFILDNVTRGLGLEDWENLRGLFEELTDFGHSIIITGNHGRLADLCGWIIEMGPGSGPTEGGKIVFQGVPEH